MPIVGIFLGSGSTAVAEVLARSGFDAICIDTEHAAVGRERMENLVRAVEVGGSRPIVRVAQVGVEIEHALDAGAKGVIVPKVDSAADASRAVAHAKYPPLGSRGVGPGRASAYGRNLWARVREANDDLLLIVQIETGAGLASAEAIVSTPGVDMVFVGPGDLAVSLEEPIDSHRHRDAIETIVAAGRAAGILVGMFCGDADAADHWLSREADLVLVRSDLALLAEVSRGLLTTLSSVEEQALDGP